MKIKEGFKTIPLSKNDPEYKYYLSGCLTKRAYEKREDVIKAASKLGSDKKIKTQVYFCNYCGKYHVTSHCWQTKGGANHNIQVCGKNGKTIRRAARIMSGGKHWKENKKERVVQ